MTRLLEAVLEDPRRLARHAGAWERLPLDPDALPAPPPEDDEQDLGLRDDRVRCEIFSPPGLPSADAIAAQVRRIAAAKNVRIHVLRTPVYGPRTAFRWRVRRVPSVAIGSVGIGTSGGTPGTVGVNVGPAADDRIAAALVAMERALRTGRERSAHAQSTKRMTRQDARLAKAQHAKDPAAARARAIGDELRRLRAALEPRLAARGWSEADRRRTVWTAAAMADERAESSESDAGDLAREALAIAEERVAKLLAWRSGCGLSEAGMQTATAVSALHSWSHEEALRALDAWAGFLRPIEQRLASSGLDPQCAGSVQAFVVPAVLGQGWAGAVPTEDDASRALVQLEQAIETAVRRHDERDDHGDPLACGNLWHVLRYPDGRTEKEIVEDRRSAAEAAAAEAWTRAAGLGERARIEAVLAAVLPFDDLT